MNQENKPYRYWKLKKRKCELPECKVRFQPRNSLHKFCCNTCKEIFFFKKKNGLIKESGRIRKYHTITLKNGIEVLDNVFGLEIAHKRLKIEEV